MADPPTFDDVLRQALAGLYNDDVRIFYDYFEDLKRRVRRHLSPKASIMPGPSAVAQSALLSMFGDLAIQQIPLGDVDEYGCPMLWPLLLKYLERHCDKWNKYYLALKRNATVLPLEPRRAGDEGAPGIDPPDRRAPADAEAAYIATLEALVARLSPDDQAVLEGRLKDETLEQIALRIGRCESTVSNRLSHIRVVLEAQ
jgi:DNA-directed RNA polymerase specialized sigma24 family protein